MNQRFERWCYGLVGGVIGGAATSLSSAASVAMGKSFGMDMPVLTLRQIGFIAGSGAFWTLVAYLKQSPLPPLATGDTTIFPKNNLPTDTAKALLDSKENKPLT